MMHFLSFTWNPSTGLDLGFYTIQYYSLMFVISFIVGWFLMKRIYKKEGEALEKLDSLFIYMVLAILIGARLGHVIFYQPELFEQDFWSVFLPFETKPEFRFTGFRGLASHGAGIGVVIALFMYNRKVLKKPILWIFDRIVIPVSFGAILVRLGNFINSEIIGKETNESFPFAVRFIRNYYNEGKAMSITNTKSPDAAYNAIENNPQFAQYLQEVPWTHPAQLYEAFGYIFVFLILWYIYEKTEKKKHLGFLFGLFLILLWTVRFIAEIFKKSQDGFADGANALLSTGQWLSIPFIIAGIYLMLRSKKKTETT
ncbi:prolipoprotein diacylglyceryl transferase [Aureisphaera galaxeae]|uniref:prolipoprotein diacylglyceryl transferase n=1 Tax=Aureisphaera galaxeae TaxID=1538023 RepID=UPI00234FB65B|nr:prolipoprotein diacylglyceryl transferase [Aureisphaera galaxeae]MDC8005488.1 prolipoprotein diacylglyceryl transferase [Aureisphaera galaxeae]